MLNINKMVEDNLKFIADTKSGKQYSQAKLNRVNYS